MNTVRFGLVAIVVGALTWGTIGGATAWADDDDDWEDRWEEYHEDLEEWREEARERAEERWENAEERLEEWYEDGRRWRRYGPPVYYPAPGPIVRHGGSVMRQRVYYPEPVYEPYYMTEPRVYRYYPAYPFRYRYYGVPGAGYVEGPYGERSVQVGPVRVFWYR